MKPCHRFTVMLAARSALMVMMVVVVDVTSAEPKQNFCSNSTVLRTRTQCHSCTISIMTRCPSGFKQTPGSTAKDCLYYIRTATLQMALMGCSFECYKDAEVKQCCPGFWGPDCNECPEQAERPCSNRGVCSDGIGGNGTCSCQDGFAGTACEDCQPDRYGPTCSSVCSCVHGLCDAGLKGNGRCTCLSGYKGPNCNQELPECASLGCKANSRCIEEALTGRLMCQCLPGFQTVGSECVSINPCLKKVCHDQATCVHTGPNKHMCACNQGYRGDGRVCMVVNPCQTNNGGCNPLNAHCAFVEPGKSKCICRLGFETSPNGSCVLKELCQPNSCHQNANCSTVVPGRIKCTCRQGYVGDGKVCYGNIMERLTELNTDPDSQWRGQLTMARSLFGIISWQMQNLGPFTVFVSVNKGFRGWPASSVSHNSSKANYLCKMHMVPGAMSLDAQKSDTFYTLTGKSGEIDSSYGESLLKVRLYGSKRKSLVLKSNLLASNGIIHIISKLMDVVEPTVESDVSKSLSKIISEYGKFDTFKSLLDKANMASLLDGTGPMTVFAPTSTAFTGMPDGYLDYMSGPDSSPKRLELLRHHIIPSVALDAFNVASNPSFMSTANQLLMINITDLGRIVVNGAAVTEAAVEAKNGRLYVLDAVMIPPSIEPVLPQRCDVTESKIKQGECMSCSNARQAKCPSGITMRFFVPGCVYLSTVSGTAIPMIGCSLHCNSTVTTPACCKGFYGTSCATCPGGHLKPCSGHGQCLDGLEGNGTCICHPNYAGSRCQYCTSPNKYGPNCDKTCRCIHGTCDSRPDSDGRCQRYTCQRGFIGLLCDRQVKPCGDKGQYCHAHADCDFSQSSRRCVCKPGYQGDGITCVESDPCAPPLRGGCSIRSKCVRTGPGNYTCECLTGYTKDGGDCSPINNCNNPDNGGCHPNATCIFVGPGQSDCSCKGGYKGNGRECEPVNQCISPEGGCHYLASCLLLSYRWTCVCNEGYVGNGKICYGSVMQELMVLPDASEFYSWTINSALSDLLSGPNVTLLLPSSFNINQMSSDDKHYWTSKGSLPSLIKNHIIPGIFPLLNFSNVSSVTTLLETSLPVSNSNERTLVGGAYITTADIAATNGVIHFIDRVLMPDRKLSEGLLATLQLHGFSLFRSYLIQYNLTDEIEKASGFTVFAPCDAAINDYLKKIGKSELDVNTTRYHVVVSDKLLKTDLQGGGYKETMLGFNFQLGIYPRDGQLFVNEALMNTSNFLTGNGVIHSVSTVLPIRWNRCDEAKYLKEVGPCLDCLFPSGEICPKNSIPDKSAKIRRCMYRGTFHGQRLMHMGCKATCLSVNIKRKCCSGFFGPQCESCPGASGQVCFGNGVCLDGTNGTGVCQCNKGYSGTACEICETGKYGVHCDQDCKCKNGRCNDGMQGDGTCECDVGWRSVLCDEKIQSTAEELCGPVKCHTSANCVYRTSQPQCLCAAGFEGNGTFCKAKDKCALDNGGCSPFAVCKRTQPGQRDCVCSSGYNGDGLVCVEINPCLEGNGGCHVHADCIHVGPNKTSCTCNDGYSGNGLSCKMTDLCLKNNGGCHKQASCSMISPNVLNCTCKTNFIGDGYICRGSVAKELVEKNREFVIGLMATGLSLTGRGPFTIFAPESEVLKAQRSNMEGSSTFISKEEMRTVIYSHIVMCHTLLPDDLRIARNLTTLSGRVVTTRASQDNISINAAQVTYSHDVCTNGIFYEVNKVLYFPKSDGIRPPSPLNLSDVADRHGYRNFFKLLQDTGVIDQIQDPMYRPVTVFLPTDSAMSSLPQQQKDFLFHQQNRAELLEYLKYHILLNEKANAEVLTHMDSPRTLQGSPLSFLCGGMDDIGEIFVNDEKCRIVQRHLVFNGGIAYGIDCLLTPPSLGGRCDKHVTFDLPMNCRACTGNPYCPRGSTLKEVNKCDAPFFQVTKNSGCRSICTTNIWQPKCCPGYYGRDCQVCPGGARSPCNNRGQCDDGHLGNGTCTCVPGFGGLACEQCTSGFFGTKCQACNCTEHGSCDDGRRGTGLCFCELGWTGQRCETKLDVIPVCDPACSPKAICQGNNTCVCRPFHDGDGYSCTVVDMCQIWNGGCAPDAKCSQVGDHVTCTCPKGHSGDGFTCQPIDPCTEDNGGCHEHADCTMTGPGKRRCSCKNGFIGDGVTCEVKQLPISRCRQDNAGCHSDARCTDLHFEDSTLGVFHLRSAKGQYKLNFKAAEQACTDAGGSLATYNQLSYAQQGGMNMCAAGWLDQARVAYPTTYSNPKCGFGHVGIVDYGVRKDLGETWDVFCYRMKEVRCECKLGYVGDGYSCTGNLLQVLKSTPTFSNFLTQILNYSRTSDLGKRFLNRLGDITVQSTLFVPDNDGLMDNQTLSHRDLESHLLNGMALPLSQLTNGRRLDTGVGRLTVQGVVDLLDPTALSSRYVNNQFITQADIQASNGIIHVLQGPIRAPPQTQAQQHVAHKAGMGVGVVLLIAVVTVALFVAYRFYRHNTKPFRFHYFKEDDNEEEEPSPLSGGRSISNPVYEPGPEESGVHEIMATAEKLTEAAEAPDLLQIG
ncbi:stabilin-2 [Synchiropus splendidus]|uniref:stabilin-2 n=1 Tax=Synchiropus splendidus TaxID=270530 RepID=UPI00237E7E76|nr:stabilin-2 [Synchiropus splendidus]